MKAKKTWRIQELQGALLGPVLVQITLMILTGLLFDGGFCTRIVMAAIAGHWLLVSWIALRRRNALTKFDVTLIRIGFFPWLLIATLLVIALHAMA